MESDLLPGTANPERPVSSQARLPMDVTQILRDVDRLVESHQSELRECLRTWCEHFPVPAPPRNVLDLQETSPPVPSEAWARGAQMRTVASMESRMTIEDVEGGKLLPEVVQGARMVSPDEDGRALSHAHTVTECLDELLDSPAGQNWELAKKDAGSKYPGTPGKSGKKKNPTLEAPNERKTKLEALTTSKFFEAFSVLLILANAAFIGWETQMNALRAMKDGMERVTEPTPQPVYFLVLGCLFNVLMTTELALRWATDGFIDFFRTDELMWNMLDAVVVFAGLIDLVMELVYMSTGLEKSSVFQNLGALRVLRLMRMVRVARVIRVMRFFRELRIMIYSIVGCLKSMVWVALVLAALFFLFGVSFTAAIPGYLTETEMWHDPANQELITYFGTLDRAVLTLYMSMCGGIDWGQVLVEVDKMSFQWRYLFLLYTILSIFAVSNIVTGIFVESAMKSNQADREVIIHEELESKKDYVKALREMFDEMDRDNTGYITLDEFEARLNSERAVAYFKALKLDVTDARVLFALLDYDMSRQIDISEFIEGCYKLQGEARSLDAKIMQYEVRFVRESMATMASLLKEIKSAMNIVGGTFRPEESRRLP